jgi:hypothetical protein
MTNSPASNSQPSAQPTPQPPSPKSLKPTPAQTLSPQQEIASLRQQYQAVSEMLWETIHQLAPETHEVTVPGAASNPLWELFFLRPEKQDAGDPVARVRICAATIPELSEQDKKRVVRFLRGTGTPLEAALAHLSLRHPPLYVEQKIKDRIKWGTVDGQPGWESITPAETGEKVKNLLHLPK